MNSWRRNEKETYPLQQWKMDTETQTILGHRCQKATCH